MTDPGYGQGQAYGQGQQYGAPQGTAYPTQGGGMPFPTQGTPTPKGFLSSLFDTSFSSFVTPTIIKVVYIIIMIILGLETVGWMIWGFIAFHAVGIIFVPVALLIGLVGLALWRMMLELFMVIFRMSDDIRALRGNR